MVSALRMRLALLLRREHWWAEFWSGAVALSWGTYNVLDSTNIDTVSAYKLSADIAPEPVLQIVAGVIGFLQIFALITNHTVLRGASALMATWLYTFLLVSFSSVTPWPPGWVFCGGWLGVNIFAVGRVFKGLE